MLSHYKIKVNEVNPLGNFVTVEILWWDKECPAPTLSGHTGDYIFVEPPNIIERLCGITFKEKVEKAKKKLTIRAENHLKLNQELSKQIDRLL